MTYIVGGSKAADGVAPFQCSIQESKIHSCGCSVISEKWILTAAHCVYKRNAHALEILVGTNDLTTGGTYYKVERYATHERYFLIFNDIAVIRVQGKIEFTNRVQPIELLSDHEVPDQADVQLTGWGDLKVIEKYEKIEILIQKKKPTLFRNILQWRGQHPKHLQIIKLKAMSRKSCRKTILRFVLHKGHMCTSSKSGFGACFVSSF